MLSTGKLGFWGLTALVFGLVIGVGIFNLPQNLAVNAGPGCVFLAWLITGLGILPLVMVFKYLSERYPQYNAGLYQYAQAGFGNYVGFNIAWGYWLCSAFSNVAYAIMFNDTLGAFIPVLHNHGWETILFGSVFIWLMFFIVSRGVRTAKFVNNLLSLVKIVMLIFIIVVFIMFFDIGLFSVDIWGKGLNLGNVGAQISHTMMITLFCFFGVEGAVMMSARARRSKDVGRAGVVGFLISVLLYLAVSLLCFGLMSQAELSGLKDPSIAYILRHTCGEWSYWFVISAMIIALLGGWVAWTLVVAQVPYEASLVGILPKCFSRVNRHNMPAFGLMASSIAMEFFMLLVVFADDMYLAALQVTGLMILPCYLFTGLFMLKVADSRATRALGLVTFIFCCWMIYAGGFYDFLLTSGFYLLGLPFFYMARKEKGTTTKIISNRNDKICLGILILFAIAGCWILLN